MQRANVLRDQAIAHSRAVVESGTYSGQVYAGRVDQKSAVIRLITGPKAAERMQHELQVFQALTPLQGKGVVQLLGAGRYSETSYFTATKLVEGMQWAWRNSAHRQLDPELLQLLAAVHSCGVVHRDFHEGNLLVTPDHRLVLLDFHEALHPASVAQQEEEMSSWQRWLSRPLAGMYSGERT
ncbi:hypothetical protein WJX73_003688 [Symbiochloris irregularis]|uniref:Protein kinase domain-containing protein n=1 Tax=Symbiochloris irregularis TaxID=706552 RepID=A0AAW1NT62_9CHLO